MMLILQSTPILAVCGILARAGVIVVSVKGTLVAHDGLIIPLTGSCLGGSQRRSRGWSPCSDASCLRGVGMMLIRRLVLIVSAFRGRSDF